MANFFYLDSLENIDITYEQLFSDISEVTIYNPYCKSNSYYYIFKQIVISLIIGEEIILLDSDFSDNEIGNLIGGISQFENAKKINISIGKHNFEEIDQIINNNKSSWRISLFTSGTTGLPKKISHNFDSISRFVKKEAKFKNNVWGFAYNPTHMAGLQVFFQAFLNQNSIVRLFGVDRVTTFELINKHKITNISATPTFFRFLLPADQLCESVINLTSGGEKFDANIMTKLQQIFPNSKFHNIYASTEAGTLFAAKGDVFLIKPDLQHLVKIFEHELYLHYSLVGNSESLIIKDGWYATGDLIEVISIEPFTFKFKSRKNEMINTGGYKVNPIEVEELIRSYPGIKEVYVYGKPNNLLGNIVCCDIVKDDNNISEKQIIEWLRNKLQEFKLPRIIKFVEELATTRTGKISRK